MAKGLKYRCSQCGAIFHKWSGKCLECGEWDTLKEVRENEKSHSTRKRKGVKKPQLLDKNNLFPGRIGSGFKEVDRVLGGGMVPGEVLLLGGEPGIGKSTLVSQILAYLSSQKEYQQKLLYVSAEESLSQVNLRAQRLNLDYQDKVWFLESGVLEDIEDVLDEKKPYLAVVDSIQTLSSLDLNASSGGIAQVRECVQRLINKAKANNIILWFIGHITKSGDIAGPKQLEHLVDAVLYLEGERFRDLRLLRSWKNRFGPVDEVGVFKLSEKGLQEINNPAALFLADHTKDKVGSCLATILTGSRVLVVEIQALSSKSTFGHPRRTSSGFPLKRLLMLIGVLNKKLQIRLADQDIFVNVVGGFSVREPAVDLAVCLAIYSSFMDQKIPADLVALGEVGLSGEVRRIPRLDKRLKEIVNLGLKNCLFPHQKISKIFQKAELNYLPVSDLETVIDLFSGFK